MDDERYTAKERLAYLIDLKSIVTIFLTAIFGYLAVIGSTTPEDFLKVFLMIIVFYFGTQSGKAS